MKKAQATMFAILGIVIAAVIVGAYFLRNEISKGISEAGIKSSSALHLQSAETRGVIENCLKSVLEDGVLKVAANGGYYAAPKSVRYEFYDVPVYYDEGIESVPSVQDIETAIAEYMNANAEICAGSLAGLKFPAKSAGKPKARVLIAKNEVRAEVDWKITIGGEEESATVSDFNAKTAANIPECRQKAVELYEKQKAMKAIAMTDLAMMAERDDYVLHFDFADEAVIYVLAFNKTILKGKPLIYTFAVKPKKGAKPVYGGMDFSNLSVAPSGKKSDA